MGIDSGVCDFFSFNDNASEAFVLCIITSSHLPSLRICLDAIARLREFQLNCPARSACLPRLALVTEPLTSPPMTS